MPSDPLMLALYAVLAVAGTIGGGIALLDRVLKRSDKVVDGIKPQLEDLSSAMRTLASSMDKNNTLVDGLRGDLKEAITTSVDEHHKTQALVERLTKPR